MSIVTLPVGISEAEWAAQLRTDFSDVDVPQLSDFRSWQDWALYICDMDPFASNGCPRPSPGEDFLDWAIKFVQVMFV